MIKIDDGEKKRKKKKKKKRMAFLVATTSLPAVYRQNDDARTTAAGTPHARANIYRDKLIYTNIEFFWHVVDMTDISKLYLRFHDGIVLIIPNLI